ncbi:MAG: class I SAM-dependent methyltransferase [Fibrella sp.]|nr:class I SAM-dependent methyltransferase [Armatimonadota bacterium]
MQEHAARLAEELRCGVISRRGSGMPKLFELLPDAQRAVVVQTNRLLLVDRAGHSFFQHPNMGYLRFGHVSAGGQDTLIEATEAAPGDVILDCTLGYASEATLLAYVVGETGEVHGVEAVPELGVVVRAGLQTVTTGRPVLNEAMRRVRVVHLGPNIEYLRACPDQRYDVIYFDPFFESVLEESQPFAPIRLFGDHARLTPETITEAVRVARRRVVVKTTRWSETFADLGITERLESRNGKVAYGIVRVGAVPL